MRASIRLLLPLLLFAAGCAPKGAEPLSDAPLLADDLVVDDAEMTAPSESDGSILDPREPPEPAYGGPDYFPAALGEATVGCDGGGEARPQPVLGDFERKWYSRHLAAAGERPLHQPPPPAVEGAAATLRFTWLRSFHAPVVIRVETDAAGERRLFARQLSGAGGYDPGHVEKRLERALTRRESKRLEAALEGTRLFDRPGDPCELGVDGAQWIFESSGPGGYRFASYWTPREGSANRLGLLLMELTGWTFGMVY
jgi:hypothetical protein